MWYNGVEYKVTAYYSSADCPKSLYESGKPLPLELKWFI